ncbi:MAG: hypothetical protein IPO77_03755 [Acidobacteria bacterium]|nr:hypothetical protein [Acidobacteriota bacterium]
MLIRAMRSKLNQTGARTFPKRGLTPRWKNWKSRWLIHSLRPNTSARRIITRLKIYKSYPIYAPGKEPPGYLEWLKKQEPQIIFDAGKLKTEADWIKAGEIVFHASRGTAEVTAELIQKPEVKDGYPYAQYVVSEKGKVEYGGFSCALCHTRVMPDGTVLKGAQGTIADDRESAWLLEHEAKVDMEGVRNSLRRFYAAPWVKPDPQANLAQLSLADIIGIGYAIPPGVISRQGTALTLTEASKIENTLTQPGCNCIAAL